MYLQVPLSYKLKSSLFGFFFCVSFEFICYFKLLLWYFSFRTEWPTVANVHVTCRPKQMKLQLKCVSIHLKSKVVFRNVTRNENNFLSRVAENDDSDLRVLMDQKAYLEEINRNLKWVYIAYIFLPRSTNTYRYMYAHIVQCCLLLCFGIVFFSYFLH